MVRRPSRYAVLVGAGALALLAGAGTGFAQPSQDLVRELEDPIAPSDDAHCPDPSLYSTARPNPPGEPTLEGVRVGRSGTFTRFDVVMPLERDWSYYAWKLGLPLTLIVLMAYGVYYIPASAVPQQIGLGTTAMLTTIAYMLTLGNALPRISYLTRADRFFVGCAVLVFFGLAKGVITLALAQGPRAHYIQRADRWGRLLYPRALLANAALAFLL